MAIRRFPSRLLMSAGAAAATRAQAPPLYSGTVRRLFSRVEVEAMATAAAARGQRARACALGRVRTVRADADAASSAVAACARAFYANVRRQAEAAASISGQRLRQASHSSKATFVKVMYGETAPPKFKISSIKNILLAMEPFLDKYRKVENIVARVGKILEIIERHDPELHAAILTILLSPATWILTPFAVVGALMMHNSDPTSVITEPMCPFLAIYGVTFDVDECAAKDCLLEVSSVVLLSIGGLAICLVLDLAQVANYLTCRRVADMIKGKGRTPEEIPRTLNIKNVFTPEEEEEVRKENQWAFE